MKKYLIIFSVIIILYYIQKYCIESEVDKFLVTKKIVEKWYEKDIINFNYKF